MNRCHDLVACTVIRFVHLKTDIRSGSEILAPGMNCRRAAEAANIFAHCFWLERPRRLVKPAKDYFQIVLRIESNEMFWQGRCLNKKEPPHVLGRKLLIGLSIHRQRWSDVHETNLFDALGKVETQAMGDPSAPIMGTHKKLIVPKMTHRLYLVQRRCAERIIDVAISVSRAARIPVSSQIRYVDRVPLGESRRHFVPGDVSLGDIHAEGALVVRRLYAKQGWSLRWCEPQPAQSPEKASPRHPSTASAAVRAKIRVSSRQTASLEPCHE